MALPALVWNPVFLIPLSASAAGVGFGLFVFGARPTLQNRALGAFLVLFGLGEIMSGSRFLFADAADAYALWVVRHAHLGVLIFALLLFYASLPTPLTRPLRPRWVQAALLVAAVAFAVASLARPQLLSTGMERDDAWAVWLSRGDGPLWAPPVFALLVALFVGPALAYSAYRHAKSEEERRKLRSLATALGVYSVLQASSLGVVVVFTDDATPLLVALNFIGIPLANLALVVFLAYGVLRAQLFGIELRLKWTLSRGTTAALFVGVFFVLSEAAQSVFEARYGPVFGLAGAGLLVFALAPLQRAADRIADRAMPQVRDTPEYRERRSRAIYRAAVESAARDGVVTDKERDMLATLQVELGIPATEALAMEREAVRLVT